MENEDVNDGASRLTPPYLPFVTFDKALDELRDRIPPRIDRTVFPTKSTGLQSWILAALRFFQLIDTQGVPQAMLQEVVQADDRGSVYSDLCRNSYSDLFSHVEVERATQGQLREWFRAYGLSDSTADRSIAFFLDLAKKSGIQTSPHFRKSRAVGPTSRKRSPKPADTPALENGGSLAQDQPCCYPAVLKEKLILGLVEKLPDPGDEFPASKRELWKRMADTIFDMVYGESEDAS